jgi:hypothetical protein
MNILFIGIIIATIAQYTTLVVDGVVIVAQYDTTYNTSTTSGEIVYSLPNVAQDDYVASYIWGAAYVDQTVYTNGIRMTFGAFPSFQVTGGKGNRFEGASTCPFGASPNNTVDVKWTAISQYRFHLVKDARIVINDDQPKPFLSCSQTTYWSTSLFFDVADSSAGSVRITIVPNINKTNLFVYVSQSCNLTSYYRLDAAPLPSNALYVYRYKGAQYLTVPSPNVGRYYVMIGTTGLPYCYSDFPNTVTDGTISVCQGSVGCPTIPATTSLVHSITSFDTNSSNGRDTPLMTLVITATLLYLVFIS